MRATGSAQPSTYFWNTYPTRENQPYDFYRTEWVKGTNLPDGGLIAGGLASVYFWDRMPTRADMQPVLTLRYPTYANGDGPDVVFAGGRLFLNNYNGNNVHVYNTIPTRSDQRPDFALGSPSVDYSTLKGMNYIQNPVVVTDGTNLVVTSDFDRALWIWKSLPLQSGTPPDIRISLVGPDLAPWDNALHNGRLVLAGKRRVGIWDSLPIAGEGPSRTFSGHIGSVQFDELRGVALDDRNFYLADANGTLSIWNGLPVTGDENPIRSLQLPGSPPNHLNSDGSNLCVTAQSAQPAVYVYRVGDLSGPGPNVQPFKTIGSTPGLRLNLPASALAFEGGLAIANTSGNSVLVWSDINDAGDPAKAIVLGQNAVSGMDPAIGVNRLFMPASLAFDGTGLWVGEVKFSSRILRYRKGTTPRRWVVPGITGGSELRAGLALVNHSATPAVVQLGAYSDGGELLATAVRSLSPGSQSSEVMTQPFPMLEALPAWILLESQETQLAGFFLHFDDGVRLVDGAAMTDIALRDFVFPAAEEGDVCLINPGGSAVDFQLQLVSDSGQSLRSFRGSVPARGRIVVSTRALRSAGEQGGYLRCSSGAGLVSLLASFQGERLILLAPADAMMHDPAVKFLPHCVFGGGYTTRLRLVNLDERSQVLTVTLRGDDGTVRGEPAKVSLPPWGAAAVGDSSAFGLSDTGGGLLQGYLRIDGVTGRFAGQAIIGDPSGNLFGAAVSLSASNGSETRCAQAANTGTWYTGAAIVNAGEQQTPVYVELVDPGGAVLAGGGLVLQPGGRWTGLLPQLLGTASFVPRAYFLIARGQPGISLAVIGTGDLSALAAISP